MGGGKKGAVLLAGEGPATPTSGSGGGGGRGAEKLRKKLNEVEAQLVLASPSLLFQVNNRCCFFAAALNRGVNWKRNFVFALSLRFHF